MPEIEPDWAVAQVTGFRLRENQRQWAEAILTDRAAGYGRVLVDAPGGVGKTSLAAYLAIREWNDRAGRTLILCNRDRLVQQTAKRIRRETGMEVDIEMGKFHASPFAQIVVASIQTIGRLNRLTGFADSHFSLVIPDEAHRSLADQFLRVIFYFHYSAASLAEDWKRPADGTYKAQAFVVGMTATPDLGDKKNLGDLYQKFSVRYSYLEAVRDGWLVPPIAKNIPVKIDIRKFRTGRTVNGTDFRPEDISAALIPIIEELALQIKHHASDRKTMTFLPSVETARLMTEALCRLGMNAIFVSGECFDVEEKTEAFVQAGPGSVLCNAVLYVEGIDFPDVDCVAWFRATMSRAFFIQGLYRASRVLPDLVNDDMSAEERIAAIAASPKRNMLVLDPLYVFDRIKLCDWFDLFTSDPAVKEKLKQGFDADSIIDSVKEAERKAERDTIAALAKEAKKQEHKQARMLDPLTSSISLTDETLKNFVPTEAWHARPIAAHQTEFLVAHDLNPANVPNQGYADRLIKIVVERDRLKLATPGQINELKKMTKLVDGRPVPMWSDTELATMSKKKAGPIVGRRIASLKQRVRTASQMVDWERAMS